MRPSIAELAAMIDHTALKPDTTVADIERLCAEAIQYGFAAVCVNSCYVDVVARRLAGTKVGVCAVAGFPMGAQRPPIKASEAELAVTDGATEIDMVINIGALRDGREVVVREEIAALVRSVRMAGERMTAEIGRVYTAGRPIVKVIIETCYLNDDQKRLACRLAAGAGADYVKTSTGFGPAGATVEDVRLMREAAGGLKVKAAGGIRDLATALAMVDAGASRLGASAGVKIIRELADALQG